MFVFAQESVGANGDAPLDCSYRLTVPALKRRAAERQKKIVENDCYENLMFKTSCLISIVGTAREELVDV